MISAIIAFKVQLIIYLIKQYLPVINPTFIKKLPGQSLYSLRSQHQQTFITSILSPLWCVNIYQFTILWGIRLKRRALTADRK